MIKYLILIILLTNLITADSLSNLLEEVESNKEKSLYTVDEKLGNVTVYSQKELRLMQYTTLSDLLKEIPISNLNKNKFGNLNLSLPGSKTDVSGFFRVFINNHEVSSNYTMTPSAAWMELPMDLVDYVEIYRGNSSFSLGSESGIFFIRVYTKDASKENASKIFATATDNGSNSEAIAHSDTLENGWSYLAYLSHTMSKDSVEYEDKNVENDANYNYLYLNVKKEDTDINFGYTYMDKDNYFGMSIDAEPDDGQYISQDFFLDFTTHFLQDDSVKLKLSYDVNKLKYEETNSDNGIAAISVINNPVITPEKFNSNNKVIKTSALLSKEISFGRNNLLAGIDFQNKEYDFIDASAVFSGVKTDYENFSSFDSEITYSAFLQDDYRLFDNLILVINAKVDKYERNDNIEDETNEHYRVGAIYTVSENLGFKAFYTKTQIVPSFYNIDYKMKSLTELKTQKYKYYYVEGVYAKNDYRFSFLYNNVEIKDFIFYTPIGFYNVDYIIDVDNYVFDLDYTMSENHRLHINYFTTTISNAPINNSNQGAYVKLLGEFGDFEYFISVIYRNAYEYEDISVDDTYNSNLGVTYNISKDIALSLKAENLFDKSTESLYKEGDASNYFITNIGNFALEDLQQKITFSTKWVF